MTEPIEVVIAETFHSFASTQDPEYLVNAFFEDDRRPLHYWDVELALRLLQRTRQDLLKVIQSATQEQLSKPIGGEVSGCKHTHAANATYAARRRRGIVGWHSWEVSAFRARLRAWRRAVAFAVMPLQGECAARQAHGSQPIKGRKAKPT